MGLTSGAVIYSDKAQEVSESMTAKVLHFVPRDQLGAIVKYRDIVAEVKSEYLSQSQRFPWIVGFSGGKDSTVLAQAVVEAVLEISPGQET